MEVELATGPALGVDVSEARLRCQVVAVAVDVLTEQRDLPEAGGGQRARLVDDLVERPAALRTATERNDAVGACLVAAVDDRQPGADRRARATEPSAMARARVLARWSATPTTVRPTTVVAPTAPIGAWADASPSRSTSSGSSSGRRNRSTAGYRRCRPSRCGSRTEHPVRTTRRPGFASLRRARCPCRPITFCSAPSRIAQVLMTISSAASIDDASAQPAASSRPAISSESLRFIWQPSVHMWNAGRARSSGRYSASRRSATSGATRGVTDWAGSMSRTGRARLSGRAWVIGRPWYAE